LDKDLPLIDPDPGKCHTRRKRLRCSVCSNHKQTTNIPTNKKPCIQASLEKWSRDTSILPMQFSYINIVDHAKQSGRNSSSYVEKPLEKGYKFFYENYCHDVLCGQNDGEVHVKGKCYRSQKKNQTPHNVLIKLSKSGNVNMARCSCAAGANGYCNHTMGLLYLIDHVIKLKAPTFPKVGTCTENPQQWHKPRTQGIHAEPIMGYTVVNPKYTNKPCTGVKCTLYEARQPTVQNNEGTNELLESLKQINPYLGFCSVFSDQPCTVTTKLNNSKVPNGSILSYQLSITEGNFSVLTNFPEYLRRPRNVGDSFPNLPLDNDVPIVGLQMPLTYDENQIISQLKVTDPSLTEQDTRGQSNNPLWHNIRKNRITSSNFGLVCKRRTTLPQTKFVNNNLLFSKDISHIQSIKYGISNESKAVEKYVEYMRACGNNVQALECGVVVSPSMPWLAASPDRKVIDKEFGHGLVEIKCPYSLRNLKPEEACQEPTFYCKIVNEKPKLKEEHNYFYQVQGQLGITGLQWCDFVVYLQKGLIIQRIRFDELFWQSMITNLTSYYQKYVMPEAMKHQPDNI